ncbi:cell wall elongation regulator TseB-like domain-containing protein [Neobacillus vireti]|uniref:cell wall elongation regulator TseB-like domain-containing protein n=1 Tax=Neobacillus vireti TaxID=220686 RepID=UPI0030004A8B
MKKILIFLVLFIVISVGVFIKVYVSAQEPLVTAEEKAASLAKEKVELSEIEDFHIYHGTETVSVLEGKNKKGENIIVWIPEKSKKVIVDKRKNGLSKEEAVKRLLDEKNPTKIISVKLGMENNIPLWEIHYRSENNLINYYYVDFKTGEWLKKIENL